MDLNDRENMAPYTRGARDGSDPPNIVRLLINRQLGMTTKKFPTGFKQFAEAKASRSQLKETHCDLPASARSTFLMSFSHDCTRIASTHGDHNIYVSEVKTGKPLKTLEGHPRTPWCIAFHPTSNDILASGCLAGEVRVWDLRGGGSERWRADHDQVIASLTFHPTDQLLLIATGNSLYFWNWNNAAPDGHCSTNNDVERIRYVKFDPLGFRIITGIANLNNPVVHTGSCNLVPTGPCNLVPTGMRTNPTCPRRPARDVDLFRLCRRSVMQRLMDMPDFEIPPSQPPITTQENNASSSSSTTVNSRVGTSAAADQAGTSSETSRSTSSDNESRPHTDSRDRGVARLASQVAQQLLRESICTDVAGIVNRWTEEIRPFFYNRTTISPAESSQSEPSLLAQRGNLQMRNNSGSSAEHHNSPESSMQHSPVNNVGLTAETLMGACIRLRDYFDNFEGRMSAAVLSVGRALAAQASQNDGGQTNETSEPQAGPSQNDGETPEPQAGPSRGGNSDNLQENQPRPQTPRRNISLPLPSSEDELVNVFHRRLWNILSNLGSSRRACPGHRSTASNTPVSQISAPEHLSAERRYTRNASTAVPSSAENPSVNESEGNNVSTPVSQISAPEHQSAERRYNLRSASTPVSQISAPEHQSAKRRYNLRSAPTAVPSSAENQTVNKSKRNNVSKPVSQISAPEHQSAKRRYNLRNAQTAVPSTAESPTVNKSEGDNVSKSSPIRVQLPRHHYNHLKAEKRSNSPCLESDKEMPKNKRQKKQFETSRGSLADSPSTSQASSSTRSPVIPNLSSVQLNIDMASSSVTTPDHSSPVAMPISSSSVAAEASSAPINAEDFNTTRNSSQPMTMDRLSEITSEITDEDVLPYAPINAEDFNTTRNSSQPMTMERLSEITSEITDEDVLPYAPINAEDFNTTRNSSQPMTMDCFSEITDEDLLVIRDETNNHEISMSSAEANTQASSSSDSRIYSPRPITLEDMRDECIFTSLFTSHQCDALAGCAPSTVQIPTGSYRELHIEDPGDSDDELEIPEPQNPFPSSFPQMENISHSDLELINPQAQSPVPSSPVTSDVEVTSRSGSGSSIRLSSLLDPILDAMSDASSDDSDRPSTPPLLMFSEPYNSLLFTGQSRIALNDPLTQNHRIQVWDFTAGEFPPIYDATANIVVRRCMIHNDASVDISQDGEKLVALIPSEERDLVNNLMFGVFSLRPGQLGRTLCIWGYISNAISVSFSPLAQYVVVGSANSRPIYSNPEKAAVAQIIKINENRDSYDASYIRSFTQNINNENRLQQVSLNCVRWLPVSGLGIAYATNRGCLCICKPVAGEMFENVPNEASPESTRIGQILHRIRALYRHRPL